jgi:hypothetical protein
VISIPLLVFQLAKELIDESLFFVQTSFQIGLFPVEFHKKGADFIALGFADTL